MHLSLTLERTGVPNRGLFESVLAEDRPKRFDYRSVPPPEKVGSGLKESDPWF